MVTQDPDNGHKFNHQANGLPKIVKVSAIPKNGEAWKFFNNLVTPIRMPPTSPSQTIPSRGRVRQTTLNVVSSGKLKEQVCLLCLEEVVSNDNRSSDSWTVCLCTIANTSNGEQHLKSKHGKHTDVIDFFLKKGSKKASTGALDSGTVNTDIRHSMSKARAEKSRVLQTEWLLLNHVPHNKIMNPEFLELMKFHDPTFLPVSNKTFRDLAEARFQKMIQKIKELLKQNREDLSPMKWLSLCQDIWNSINNDGVLGSSLRLVNRDMELYTIATFLQKNNESHKAEDITKMLEEGYKERYGIDLKQEMAYGSSDTCAAAKKVSSELLAEQDDCEMHICQLVMCK